MGVSFRIYDYEAPFFMFLTIKTGLLFSAISNQFGAAPPKVMESSLSLETRFVSKCSPGQGIHISLWKKDNRHLSRDQII